MDANWDACLAFIFLVEGGYTDDPQDPGGATNLGITFEELQRWRGVAITKDDVANLQQDEAGAIYAANYWNTSRCHDLASGVDLMVFDAAVNTGNSRSARMLQQAVGAVPDGMIGPRTLAAVSKCSTVPLISKLAVARVRFYQSLPTFGHFGRGWIARVNQAEAKALELAKGNAS